jgi:hypothetical protein
MQLSSTYTFRASRQAVWDRLIDPTVVAACLPGCESLDPIGEDTYHADLTVGVAAISGRYQATIQIADQQPPTSYRLIVDGSGRAGFVKGDAAITLSEADGQTVVTVNGNGQVGGTIARVGQRLLGSVSKMMMDRFFECLQKKIG